MIISNEEKIWKADIYLRCSKDEYSIDERNTIKNQREILLNFVRCNPDIQIINILSDENISGTHFNREAFKDMINHIENGLVNCVIVKDFSRLGRNHIETGKYIERYFTAKNIRFIAVNDDYDSLKDNITDDLNSILVPFKNIINEAFIEDISMRTKTQLEIKRKNGEFVGNFAVYGYMKQGKKLIIDKYAANVVRSIFDYKIMGYNETKIANILNTKEILPPAEYKKANGIPYHTPFSKGSKTSWLPNTVKRILSNHVYLGHLEQGKRTNANYMMSRFYYKPCETWSIRKNTHEPVIDELDFELVQEIMSMYTRTSQNNEQFYLFSGFIICGLCGQSMTVKTTKKRTVNFISTIFVPLTKKLENAKTITSANLHLVNMSFNLYSRKLKICIY